MSNETFYIIFTPIVIALFVLAYFAERGFEKAKKKADKLLNDDLNK